MRVILERRWKVWPYMVLATWWCVDGCYALYWHFADPKALAFMREANWPASLSLYCMCGLVFQRVNERRVAANWTSAYEVTASSLTWFCSV